MTREKIKEIVTSFLAKDMEMAKNKINNNASLKDLDIDSFDFMDIVITVEHHFGVKIKP